MADEKYIEIKGAREHNLKNIDISIPKDKLTVITGLSGSGKSSLAFDTIYAEGQRRYVESLSAYARQFLELMKKSLCLKQPEHIAIQLHSLKAETISALNVRISREVLN